MNILRKLTIASIRGNRKRTIATVTGIALSCALILAVTGMVSSARGTILKYIRDNGGDYHALYAGVSQDALPLITEDERVDPASVHELKIIGYARADGCVNEYKPYYHLVAADKDAMQKFGFLLTEGRFPENENELLVSAHITSNGGIHLSVGDTITIDVGKRVTEDGYPLGQYHPFDPDGEAETITDAQTMTYTIVGIMWRPSAAVENYSSPGYTIVTCKETDPAQISGTKDDATYDVMVRFQNMRTAERDANDLMQKVSDSGATISVMEYNGTLVMYEGGLGDGTYLTLLMLAAIIIVIILVTSVFVIRNSFRISVSERTRQYGLLASVGATSKQIRKSVLYEGWILGLIGIPAGILIGIAAVRILIYLLNYLLSDLVSAYWDLTFVFSTPPVVILVAVGVSALTIFFACLAPARTAAKIAPVEAIRGNREINLKHGSLRSSRIIKKIFGIGGVIASNNLKRSRKKYRTTVVSLVLSVSVFIALSWLTTNLRASIGYVYNDYQYNLQIAGEGAEVYEALVREAGITEYSYSYSILALCDLDTWGSAEGKAYYDEVYEDDARPENLAGVMEAQIVVINSDYFARYVKDLGIDADPAGIAILHNEIIDYQIDQSGNVSRKVVPMMSVPEGATITLAVADEHTPTGMEAYVPFGADSNMLHLDVTIATVDPRTEPMGWEGLYSSIPVIYISEEQVPEELMQYYDFSLNLMNVHADDAGAMEERIMRLTQEDTRFNGLAVFNLERNVDEMRRLLFVIDIFLYGFITVITLIGVTNIFNTITTNMMLRSREFAMLKSVGMTTGQFHRMIALESVLYGLRSLIIGVPVGIVLSYVIYRIMAEEFDRGYFIPWGSVAIAAVFVFLIVGLTMRYSLGRINRQNIIETIRTEAI